MQVGVLAGSIIFVTIVLVVIFVVFLRKELPKLILLITELPKLILELKVQRNWKKIQKHRDIPKRYVKYGSGKRGKAKAVQEHRGRGDILGDPEDDFGPVFPKRSMGAENRARVMTITPAYHELIDKALKKLPIGKSLFNPPKKMKVGEPVLVEVRITQNLTEDLTKGLEGPGEPHIEEIKVWKYMKVCLSGSAFKIVPKISEPQIIESDKYTEWQFHVTPLKSGIQTLHLSYYVIISIAGYGDKQKAYKVGDRKVNVVVNPMYFLKCYWRFIVGTLIAIVTLIIAIIAIM